MLTRKQIANAKKQVPYTFKNPRHEHDDCIRIAYEWLDAQIKTDEVLLKKNHAIKHIIEIWADRYISISDVEIAAFLHPRIRGKYPHFNIASILIEPSPERLKDIPEAYTQNYSHPFILNPYGGIEEGNNVYPRPLQAPGTCPARCLSKTGG